MNKVRDYQALEREFISGTMSLRELCRHHGISAHSAVVVQARKNEWKEKRQAYRARASESFITHHADRMAAREAEVYDNALDAIKETIKKFRADMRATKLVRQPDGSVTEEPAWLMRPRDAALLIDRLQVLFDRPSTISEGRGFGANISAEVPVDVLWQIVELTRERVGTPSSERTSGLPDRREKRPD